MASYILKNNEAKKLEDYEYNIKGRTEAALQNVIAKNAEIITDLTELGLIDSDICLVCREYSTSRGAIDILIITEYAEIVIIETKLLKNPESTRTVVAQSIDYVKAFSLETVDEFLKKISGKNTLKNTLSEKIKNDERFMALLAQNIEKANFSVVILGDVINPNILGMVESIQSAPHLAFTIYLVELNASIYGEQEVMITPKIVANTLEIERSVIKIEFLSGQKKPNIDSETPPKHGKGSKPTLTWDQYLNNVSNKGFAKSIEEFKDKWISEISDCINMGAVGFSLGIDLGKNKKIPVILVYHTWVDLCSEKRQKEYNISEKFYNEYKESLKKSPKIYDEYLIANKVKVPFNDIDVLELKIIFEATMKMAKKIKDVQ